MKKKYNVQTLMAAAVVSTVVSATVSSVQVAQLSSDADAPSTVQEAPPPMESGDGFRLEGESHPMQEGRPEEFRMQESRPMELRPQREEDRHAAPWDRGDMRQERPEERGDQGSPDRSGAYDRRGFDGMNGMNGNDGSNGTHGVNGMPYGPHAAPWSGPMMNGAGNGPMRGMEQGMGRGMMQGMGQGMEQGMDRGGEQGMMPTPRNETAQWRQMEGNLDQLLSDDDADIDEAEAMMQQMEKMLEKIEAKKAKLEEKRAKVKTAIGAKLVDKKIKKLDRIADDIEQRLAEFEEWIESDEENFGHPEE